MKIFALPLGLLIGAAAAACSSPGAPVAPATETAAVAPDVPRGAGSYDLHEWGLVSARPGSFEVAAGPGHPMDTLTVDKPVLYVHADHAMSLRVAVTPGVAMAVAEHWPFVGSGALAWQVDVAPGPCPEPGAYPATCETPDGYCESAELGLYETTDAACLTHGDARLPLLFYRLRALEAPTLPLALRRDGDRVIVENTSWRRGVGALYRVRWDVASGATHVARAPMPAVGERVTLESPSSGGVDAARRQLRENVRAHGLTAPETEAFMGAWDQALFGVASPDAAGDVDGLAQDETPTDSPVDPLDVLSDGDDRVARFNAPRVVDAILYWLPQDAMNGLAVVEAVPAPRNLRRAMLVRAEVP